MAALVAILMMISPMGFLLDEDDDPVPNPVESDAVMPEIDDYSPNSYK